MRNLKFVGQILVVAAYAAQSLASAQEAAPAPEGEGTVQTVQISGVKDPEIMPYEKAYDMLSRVRKVSDGKMDMVIRVLSAQTLKPIPDLEISLQGEQSFEKLALSPEGFLTIPLKTEALADKAVFLTNKKKGSLRVEYFFVPKLPKENLRYGDIAASIAAAKRVRAEVLPWYLRAILPAISEVRICFPDNKQVVIISNAETVSRPALIEQKNMLTKETVYCGHFTDDETGAAKDSVVTPAPGWTPLFYH